MYKHNWAETADLATSAQQFANWMESVISEAFQDNQNLGANWQSNAASQYIGTTLKQAMNRCENTKAAMVTYHGSIKQATEIAQDTERTNVNAVTI